MTLTVLLVTKGLDIGGVERIVVDLAVGLHRRGVHVEIAVINDQRDGLLQPLLDADVTVHRLGGTDWIGPIAATRLARLVRQRRFDVVHAHGPLPSVVARMTPGHRPLVTTWHTLWDGLRLPTRVLVRLSSGRDQTMLAVSGAIVASFPSSIANGIRVLPHGVDTDAVRTAIASVPSPSPDAGRDVVAIAVASHRDVKNYPNLLRAIARARKLGAPVRLVAIGAGPQLARHRELARELGIADVVSFDPPRPSALAAIAGSDLLVVASDFEGQPLVVAEALALGKPVVATAVGRVPELVSPSVGRVVPPRDVEALAIALVEVSTNPGLRAELGEHASASSAAWTLDDVLDAHLTIYCDLTDRPT